VEPGAFRIFKAPFLLHVHETADTLADSVMMGVGLSMLLQRLEASAPDGFSMQMIWYYPNWM